MVENTITSKNQIELSQNIRQLFKDIIYALLKELDFFEFTMMPKNVIDSIIEAFTYEFKKQIIIGLQAILLEWDRKS